jgi:hypothetical protein
MSRVFECIGCLRGVDESNNKYWALTTGVLCDNCLMMCKPAIPSMSLYLTSPVILDCPKECDLKNVIHQHFKLEEKTKSQKQWKCQSCGCLKLRACQDFYGWYECSLCSAYWSRTSIQEVMNNRVPLASLPEEPKINTKLQKQWKGLEAWLPRCTVVGCSEMPIQYTDLCQSHTTAVNCKVPNCTTCLPKTPPPAPVKLECKCPIISFGIQHVDGCINNPNKKA